MKKFFRNQVIVGILSIAGMMMATNAYSQTSSDDYCQDRCTLIDYKSRDGQIIKIVESAPPGKVCDVYSGTGAELGPDPQSPTCTVSACAGACGTVGTRTRSCQYTCGSPVVTTEQCNTPLCPTPTPGPTATPTLPPVPTTQPTDPPTVTPEPTTIILFGLGLLGMVGFLKRRIKK